MRSRLIQGLEQTPGRDPTRSEETPEETREDQEEEILEEEAALETHSRADFWRAEEPRHEQLGPFPSFSTEIALKQGYSSEP